MKKNNYLTLFFLILFAWSFTSGNRNAELSSSENNSEFEEFLIKSDELDLSFQYPEPERKLSYKNYEGDYEDWKNEVYEKLVELTGYVLPEERSVKQLRSFVHDGITYHALVMEVSPELSIPAYLLVPEGEINGRLMAIHGHGSVEPVIGYRDDYHHRFGYEMAKEGFMVLCPALRGFGTLSDLSREIELDNLNYWGGSGRQFTLVTEGFLHGSTLIGETIGDLVAWERWWSKVFDVEDFDVAGISYGGDLALYYPVFSERINKIFCSGSLGSFKGIFATSYNAPAHCIPDILKWMDRSDIAGLNSPRPIMLHYGELDIPGPRNASASFNSTVEPAISELKEIYARKGAEDKIYYEVTPNMHHEMNIELLKSFLNR